MPGCHKDSHLNCLFHSGKTNVHDQFVKTKSWLILNTLLFSHFCCCLVTSCVQLFATLWTVIHQAPLSMGFPRQEYWSGFPFASPGDLPDPGIEAASPALAGIGKWILYHQTTREALLNTLPCLKYILVGNCRMSQGAQPGTL